MNYTAQQLASITHSKLLGKADLIVKNIVFDSRTIFAVNQTAFIAISTKKNSGEKYIQDAINKGIKIIITENIPENIQKDLTYIITENTTEFLQNLAKHHILQFPDLQTIGITGSNGKTIVKEWLYQSINKDFSVVKSPKSFNSQIGLPISLLQTNDNHQIGIFEVGISHPNEMDILEHIFQPKIGLLTHIGTAHLTNFQNEKQLIQEKITLFKHSEIIIYNGDNQEVKHLITATYPEKKLISYGLNYDNDVKIIPTKENSPNIIVDYFGETFSIPIHQKDDATLCNILSIITLLKQFNFNNEKISQRISLLKSIEMRLESVEGVRGNLIINDSFNLDLDSLIIAYQFINEYNKPQKILILTDFIDSKTADLYQKVVSYTNEQHFDKIFLIGKEIIQFKKDFNTETYSFSSIDELINSQQIKKLENSLILLKGARIFSIEKLKNHLELQKHDTILEINLNAILHNINAHKALLKPTTKMMAMVKAFSYGLGGYEIAEFLQHHHIDYLTVAYADEGVELRKHGITTPIMVMNPEQHSYSTIIDYNLEPEIYSFRVLENFCNQLKIKGYSTPYPIHIKLETGMHRLGFKTHEIEELITKIHDLPVRVQSIFSHLATADDDNEKAYTLQQIHIFDENSTKLVAGLPYQPIRHILNSSGIANFTDYQFDMVRIGIGMIGLSPNDKLQKQLHNAVSFKTLISQISKVEVGNTIGYNRRYSIKNNTRIATIPVGYADGIPRLLGNGVGRVKVHGKYVPIVGNICMDMMMIDLGKLPAEEGDEVVIFDTLEELLTLSKHCQTIPYEVLTSISRRVKRIYVKD